MQHVSYPRETALRSEAVISDALICLNQIEHRTAGNKSNIVFLKQFFQAPQLISLCEIYDRLYCGHTHGLSFTPNAQDITNDVCNLLTCKCYLMSPEANELARILHSPHFQALLTAHDRISSKMYEKPLDSDGGDASEEGDSVRIIRLVKEEQEPLGITVRHCRAKGCCIITRIMDGGTASRSGVLEMGDEIYEINGVSLKEKRIEDILTLLHFSINSITLKIVPVMESIRMFPRENKMFYVKCHFAYNPRDDSLLPCQEAGLAFGRNDILHVFDRTDAVWWQARKEGSRSGKAGLIPSQILQERRLYKASLENALNRKCFHNKKCQSFLSSKAKRRKFKKKKMMYSSDYTEDFEAPSILAYEEVVELTPAYDKPRPLVLIGPRFVGRNELRRLLISSDPERFITPVNYPSRKQFDHDNKNFFYTDCRDGCGDTDTCRSFAIEHKGNFEHISVESMRTFMNSGKCCVLVVPPQELPIIRTRELLPYVIFIKPPSLQRLRQTRLMSRVKTSSLLKQNRKVFTVSELQEMIQKAEEIERKYGQYFDMTIVNDDLQEAYDRLYTAAYLVAKEPQWIPVNWLT